MNLCKDCEYFSGSNFCKAPQNGLSPIDGQPVIRFATESRLPKSLPLMAATVRDFGCGPSGSFFKPTIKPPSRKWWSFLLPAFRNKDIK